MKKILSIVILALLLGEVYAQSGLYLPAVKKGRKTSKVQAFPKHPETFYMLMYYTPGDSNYRTADLDIFDSAYNIAFDRTNPYMYSMKVEAYSDGSGDDSVNIARANAAAKYFAARSHAPFPIRYATNQIHCDCMGDTTEVLRFEVPVSVHTYDYNELPESRRVLNGSLPLKSAVLITFRNNPDDCLGYGRGCYLPSVDTTIKGYYTSLEIPKGVVYSVDNTMDSCPDPLDIKIEEHLDHREIVERYSLIPHRRQIILQVGYVVLHSNFNREFGECVNELPDSVYIKFPAVQEQWDNKLRIFAKKMGSRGPEYKALSTRRIKGPKGSSQITMQAAINAAQFDTIYLGKRIQPEEIKSYLYEVKTNLEEGTVTINNKFYKAYRLDNHGEYEIKKPLRVLMHIAEEQEEFEEEIPVKEDPEEIIDE